MVLQCWALALEDAGSSLWLWLFLQAAEPCRLTVTFEASPRQMMHTLSSCVSPGQEQQPGALEQAAPHHQGRWCSESINFWISALERAGPDAVGFSPPLQLSLPHDPVFRSSGDTACSSHHLWLWWENLQITFKIPPRLTRAHCCGSLCRKHLNRNGSKAVKEPGFLISNLKRRNYALYQTEFLLWNDCFKKIFRPIKR